MEYFDLTLFGIPAVDLVSCYHPSFYFSFLVAAAAAAAAAAAVVVVVVVVVAVIFDFSFWKVAGSVRVAGIVA